MISDIENINFEIDRSPRERHMVSVNKFLTPTISSDLDSHGLQSQPS